MKIKMWKSGLKQMDVPVLSTEEYYRNPEVWHCYIGEIEAEDGKMYSFLTNAEDGSNAIAVI